MNVIKPHNKTANEVMRYVLVRSAVIVALFFSLSAFAGSNFLLLSDSEIKDIRDRIEPGNNTELSEFYLSLLADADLYLSFSSPSVVGNGGLGGKNRYLTEPPYCGWFNFLGPLRPKLQGWRD